MKKKAVLLSVQPRWCAEILNGRKTAEIRKNRPKQETPFKVYIYCTKPSKRHQTICGCMVLNSDELFRHPRKGIKYGDSIELMAEDDYTADNFLNGKVVGEFMCRKMEEFDSAWSEYAYAVAPPGSVMPMHEDTALQIMTEQGRLTLDDITEYFGDEDYKASFWHISDMVVYDRPKALSDFRVKRPPQSWMYVEEMTADAE